VISDRFEFAGTLLTAAVAAAGALALLVQAVRVRRAPRVVLVCAALLAGLCAAYQVAALLRPAAPTGTQDDAAPEWRAWRADLNRKLSVAEIGPRDLADALRAPLPPLPDKHTEADRLRRDQAVADAVLAYPGARKLLATRFGIRESFLGTGLSQPLGTTSYGQAAVHEYLIDNHHDSHPHVWAWQLPAQGRDLSIPVRAFLSGDARTPPDNRAKPGGKYEDDLAEIALRVKNPDHPLPPMIRFGRFDKKFYRNTVGRPDASHAFTSNLSEVWELTMQQAAEKSGYYYRDGGDTLFIWVFVPYHSNEFTPATWRHVLERLPQWLDAPRPPAK
jgi:hypothetical protein